MHPYNLDLDVKHRKFELERLTRDAVRKSELTLGQAGTSAPEIGSTGRFGRFIASLRIRPVRRAHAPC
jgi:hypothetical protein